MNISKEEQEAIKLVIIIGKKYGYGNMMAHLSSAWAKSLMDQYQFDEKSAIEAAHGLGYPVKMHLDLVNNGKWDETGKSYV